jgi:hypothetical protein
VRYDVDTENRISLPASKFVWLAGSRAPGSAPAPRAKSS